MLRLQPSRAMLKPVRRTEKPVRVALETGRLLANALVGSCVSREA